MLVKKIFSSLPLGLLVLAVWLFASNHCFMMDAYGSKFSKANKGNSLGCHKVSSHSKTSAEGSTHNKKHHSKCSDSGCCQPVLSKFESSLNPIGFDYAKIPFNALSSAFILLNLYSRTELNFGVIEGDSPSLNRRHFLVATLLDAANAPPF